ncbi:hypothetical protein O181_127793 [Austropuccinia psidii MF-1]|uniref:Uncharacterized protein n=1 Tax=Austropuccinia psidii MF-1 TaxID=1389203 RepID=A0A9Q3Q7A3_9BASI|nr:hypothetical protein [Austropuccinia psidii MF-1]
MEGTTPSRRRDIKSRRSRSFSGLLSGYPGISQGPRNRFGEAENDVGGVHMEEKDSQETEVAAALEGASEASEA